MRIVLQPVTLTNREDLEAIDAGPTARLWVHVPWYWHQQSLMNLNILFRLVHVQNVERAVGMIAFGPAYRDAALTQRINGAYELIHLVIDQQYQHQGIGRLVARSVLHMLAANPDCERIEVAHHPDNTASRALFLSLGFQPTARQNYDGDPVLALAREAITQIP